MRTSIASAATALVLMLLAGGASAQGIKAFDRLAGQWSGTGTIDLANGTSEPIKCRAAYDVLTEENNLQLNIRCASQSYNFDLRGSASYAGGRISGSWSEATRNASGSISGHASGDRFEVRATSPNFSADLSLLTRGDRQSVTIRSEKADSSIRGVTISLRRS